MRVFAETEQNNVCQIAFYEPYKKKKSQKEH